MLNVANVLKTAVNEPCIRKFEGLTNSKILQIAQYLTDLDDLDNKVIQPTTSLPALPAKLYKRIKDRDFVDLNALHRKG